MIMLPFSKLLAVTLQRRQAEYLQHADAQAASTGEKTPEPVVVYVDCLAHLLAEVLLNVRMALKSLRLDSSYGPLLARATALADEKWATSDAPTGAPAKGEPS